MIGIDTNVLLRATLDDDPIQSPFARQALSELTEANPGIVNVIVLVEFAWTLKRGHKYTQAEISAAIDLMMNSPSFIIPERSSVNAALIRCKLEGLEFADALIAELNRLFGGVATLTFDKHAAASPAFRLLDA